MSVMDISPAILAVLEDQNIISYFVAVCSVAKSILKLKILISRFPGGGFSDVG